MKVVSLAVFVASAALAFSFNSADAIVSGQSVAPMHYLDYPYNLLVPFFTIVCSTLLVTIVLHYYRTQWGRKSIITE
ncbi:MAG: hypothetical protein AB1351_12155 [Thermoproteota archaeon]